MAGKELGAQGRGVSSAKNSESCVYTLHFAHSAHLLTRISIAFLQGCISCKMFPNHEHEQVMFFFQPWRKGNHKKNGYFTVKFIPPPYSHLFVIFFWCAFNLRIGLYVF